PPNHRVMVHLPESATSIFPGSQSICGEVEKTSWLRLAVTDLRRYWLTRQDHVLRSKRQPADNWFDPAQPFQYSGEDKEEVGVEHFNPGGPQQAARLGRS